MALVTLSIGSNSEPRQHITACLDALWEAFGELSVSRVYQSSPVGLPSNLTSADFYNLVVALESDRTIEHLQACFKALEQQHGRQPDTPSDQTVLRQPLDIDLLSVGQLTGCHGGVELPRRDILHHAFVLRPLAELLPDHRHPLTRQRYATLWKKFDAESQPLWPVTFSWRVMLPHRARHLTGLQDPP